MSSIFACYKEIIPNFSSFIESLYQPFPTHLRINPLKVEPAKLVRMLNQDGIHLRRVTDSYELFFEASDLRSPGNRIEYFLGYIHPQALTSCLASIALSPKPRTYVLDMCASPGGKASHIAQLMNNTGLIVANELYPNRHIPLSHTLSRLGVLNCVFTTYQAQEFPLKQSFDYILADVPCSGEGRIRLLRGVYGQNDKGSKVRPRLIQLQKKIIIRGYDLLKDGGEMLYSTCTFAPEENETDASRVH